MIARRWLCSLVVLLGTGLAACGPTSGRLGGSDAATLAGDGPRDGAAGDAATTIRDGGGGDASAGRDAGAGDAACQPIATCGHVFTYPAAAGMTSVEVRGDFAADGWQNGVAMTLNGTLWSATLTLTNGATVQYKFVVNGSQWVTDPGNPNQVSDGVGGENSVLSVDCGGCTAATTGFDWRDAVIYFVFVDRFLDGDPSNNCTVAGTESTATTSTNYLGGDWAGVTQKITAGYFNDLGVNTLWITVPLKNADTVADQGTNGDTHMYSAYHGYWPSDPTQTESCFGTEQELQALVTAAHAQGLKVLFDYAMVHVHTTSPIYQQHRNDGWFTPDCICGAPGCGNYDTSCWFAHYLAHYDYTNAAARTFSVDAAIALIQQTGNDAFRLDAIKQVDPSWLAALRPAIASQILAPQSPPPRFYLVGETYDFQNRALIKSMIDPAAKLDGQFDFPLRIRLVEAILMRSTGNLLTIDDTGWSRNARAGMAGLADFMDANEDYYGTDAVMSTFVGNHDLPRSIHYAEDTPAWSNSADDGKGNAWSNQPQLSTNPRAYERLANAYALMLTNKGAPLIFYGDEIGLPGAGDPDNRRMMQWTGYSAEQQALLARLKALTAIRAAHPALRRGHRTTLSVDPDLWVYQLTVAADTVIVAINRSDSDRQVTTVPAGTPELLTGTTSASPTTIPARQTRIFSQTVIPDGGL